MNLVEIARLWMVAKSDSGATIAIPAASAGDYGPMFAA
jgi:hypothetical protein